MNSFLLSKGALVLIFVILSSGMFAQENCSNGIDDDGNGLIDLNDPQCSCNGPGPLTPSSLLPNPSFEQYTQCPTAPSQAHYLFNWQRAIPQGSVDYLNTCGYSSQTAIPQGFIPTMDGNGCIGVFSTVEYKEFIGTCLPSPLMSGTAYTLKFDYVFTKRRGLGELGCPAGDPVGPVNLTLYGASTCYPLPLAFSPVGVFEVPLPFVPVGTVTAYPTANQDWVELTMTFVPGFNVSQVILGPASDLSYDYLGEMCSPYFLLDNLRLNTATAFNEVFITQTGDFCMGTGMLTAYGGPAGGTWQWYRNGVALVGQTSSSLFLATFGTGEYTVRKIAGSNCYSAVHEVNLALNLLSIDAQVYDANTSACQNEPAILTAMGADSYSWSPTTYLNTAVGNTVVMDPQETTTYVVTGYHGICTDTDTVTVNVIPVPEITFVGDTEICAGEIAHFSVSGGMPGEDFYWVTWGNSDVIYGETADFSPTVTTTYTVGQNIPMTSCSSNQVFTITVASITGIAADTSICQGESIVLDLTAPGASNYLWSPAAGLNSTSGAQVIASPSITTTYFIDAMQENCTVHDTITVTVVPPVIINVNDATICPGQSVVLAATGATQYTWSPGIGLSSTAGSSVTASPGATTVYTIIGQTGGCSDTVEATVTLANGLTLEAEDAELCYGGIVTLNVSGAINYTWSPATGLSSATGSTVEANPTATTNYTITGTDNGCSGSTIITVTVKPEIQVEVNNETICPGYAATLTASGASNYTWSPSATLTTATGPTVTAQPGITTEYVVTGFNDGCFDTAHATVTVTPGLQISVNDFQVCAGGQAVLIASGADSYTWTPDVDFFLPDGSKVTVSPSATTAYTVTGTNTAGTCSGTAQATVELITNVPMSIQASPNPVLADYPLVTFVGQPESEELIWLFGDGTSAQSAMVQHMYPADSEAVYQVMLIVHTAGGCIDTSHLKLIVENGSAYYVPNAFTPNGDEYNNIFRPYFATGFDPNDYNMVIYNRWGETVYETNDISEGWDGTYKGLESPSGTYTWSINIRNQNNAGRITRTGSVTLLR